MSSTSTSDTHSTFSSSSSSSSSPIPNSSPTRITLHNAFRVTCCIDHSLPATTTRLTDRLSTFHEIRWTIPTRLITNLHSIIAMLTSTPEPWRSFQQLVQAAFDNTQRPLFVECLALMCFFHSWSVVPDHPQKQEQERVVRECINTAGRPVADYYRGITAICTLAMHAPLGPAVLDKCVELQSSGFRWPLLCLSCLDARLCMDGPVLCAVMEYDFTSQKPSDFVNAVRRWGPQYWMPILSSTDPPTQSQKKRRVSLEPKPESESALVREVQSLRSQVAHLRATYEYMFIKEQAMRVEENRQLQSRVSALEARALVLEEMQMPQWLNQQPES